LTHRVIVLNDGLYWDGWLVDVWQQNGDESSMRRFYSEVGMPNLCFEHRILGRFPWQKLAYRAISLVSILSIAVFVFLTAVRTNVFNPLQATVISLLLLSYPAYAVTFDGGATAFGASCKLLWFGSSNDTARSHHWHLGFSRRAPLVRSWPGQPHSDVQPQAGFGGHRV